MSAWLTAPGLLVAFLRSAFFWPALLFALVIGRDLIVTGLAERAGDVPGLWSGALGTLPHGPSLFILAGLWLAGLLASSALRVAYLAGALPVLGLALSRREPCPRFAEGLAFGFCPLLGTALLGFLVELGAQLYAWSVFLAAGLLALSGIPAGRALPLSLLGAVALASAVAVPVAASLLADGALARTALAGDGPVAALLEALRRVALRPAAFLAAALALGVASFALLGSAQALETGALGIASGAPPIVALGPRLMASVLSAALAVLLELWRLGALAALVCCEEG
ncbi:MAG TPA: hypothetical protein VMK12_08645 [Anaeromyxobacteraceae bacterium]|nr:hypothetical protein [Anaeromyxobacteraceae bacterium]